MSFKQIGSDAFAIANPFPGSWMRFADLLKSIPMGLSYDHQVV